MTSKRFLSGTMNEHAGHRGRLIAKMETGALEEHEWLEVLLFNALPRKNTNPLAHRLLSVFGSIENIFAAPASKLAVIEGIGSGIAAYLRCIGKFYERYRPNGGEAYPSHFEVKSFCEYAVREYAHRKTEIFDVYLLDKHANVIYRRRFEGFSEHSVTIPARDVAEIVALNKPSGIILVHNHPMTNCRPSKEDDDTTKKVAVLCSAHDVLLCDHYIVGYRKDVYSYRAAGEMAHISKEYSINSVLSNKEQFKEATKRQRADTKVLGESNERNAAFDGRCDRFDIVESADGEDYGAAVEEELPF